MSKQKIFIVEAASLINLRQRKETFLFCFKSNITKDMINSKQMLNLFIFSDHVVKLEEKRN